MRLAKIMSFEQFAAQECASRQRLGDAGLHNPAGHISRRTWKAIVERQAERDRQLVERRSELREEFRRLVAEGHIIEPTADQRLEATSKGEGERAAAARRILAKKEALRAGRPGPTPPPHPEGH